MELFRFRRQFDFVGHGKYVLPISALLIAASLALLGMRGLNFGIDFTGGLVIEVGYPQSVELDGVRGTLAEAGYGNAVVQHFGTAREVLIRVAPDETDAAAVSDEILSLLRTEDPGVDMRRVEFVGASVGDDLKEQGALAVIFALIGILIYVALRFEYRFAIGSVVGLVHDVILMLGFLALTGIEFDLIVLAALLAGLGYSLNDTIVIYDRMRENFLAMRKATTVEVTNAALNQTLSRTFVTGLTTLLVLFALLLLGGQVMYGFSMVLIFSVVIGPVSSLYVASWAALVLGVSKQDLMPPKKEGADSLP